MQEWSLTSILQLSQPEEEAVEQVLPAVEPSSLAHSCKWAEERHDRIRMQEWSLTSILQLSQPEEEAVEQVLPAVEPSSLAHSCKWAEERHDRIRWVITRRSKEGRSFGV
ncbi:hypothetical protein CAPTEDRAFT_208220 [Capitella teleta]|uniref:Uncharacterized protein n=1 Tax=Capitella teleta TaxID=283909 RepID=R7VJ01_CAPTE|nr:hypothetical protein CAPTEDRAFT_208220 [Capitella teleta]|eukprot:ELU15670.1 hypothetical protein CAPTEDRAFT_208220 [Capitella teleta]